MKKKELIEALNEYPDDIEILVEGYESEYIYYKNINNMEKEEIMNMSVEEVMNLPVEELKKLNKEEITDLLVKQMNYEYCKKTGINYVFSQEHDNHLKRFINAVSDCNALNNHNKNTFSQNPNSLL
jgi:DNA integrity scanning protein DisA with diadenylate cyclase activity